MFHRDEAAIVAAAAAMVLCAASWVIDGMMSGPAEIDDRAGLAQASSQALEHEPAGGAVVWRDHATRVTAVITPARAFRDDGGRWCRGYDLEFAPLGRDPTPRTRHVACRDDHGAWNPVAEPALAGPATTTALDRWLYRLVTGAEEQVADTGG